ncbi:MAG: hypothetical protein KCHDKBKB_01604 [Elusimicrobia bacterium]|nr:hypothetical protein [Elusimicrobiota bacterium]
MKTANRVLFILIMAGLVGCRFSSPDRERSNPLDPASTTQPDRITDLHLYPENPVVNFGGWTATINLHSQIQLASGVDPYFVNYIWSATPSDGVSVPYVYSSGTFTAYRTGQFQITLTAMVDGEMRSATTTVTVKNTGT